MYDFSDGWGFRRFCWQEFGVLREDVAGICSGAWIVFVTEVHRVRHSSNMSAILCGITGNPGGEASVPEVHRVCPAGLFCPGLTGRRGDAGTSGAGAVLSQIYIWSKPVLLW